MAHGNIKDVPAAAYAELLSGPMINIYVGKAKRHWSLHRNLLCHHSELLEAELEGDDEGKGRKDELELLHYDPAGFELLVKWLYQGKLDDVSDMADANQKYEYAVSCHKLYLLCSRLDMPQLKNVAMDQYRKGLNEAELVPDADEIDEIYRKSSSGSPFRRLMTSIAARQIMDPDNERDVETYRQCFENNTDFAIDLFKAIRQGTGGMLFKDPTELENPCDYHDHEDGPSCHIKGKGKVKQARKTPAPRHNQQSANLIPSTNSDPQNHLPRPHPPETYRQPPPRQARLQDRTSVGPLRRRLTSPAISTVGTSPEIATADLPPNPDILKSREKDREKWRKVTPPEKKKRQPSQSQIVEEMETVSTHPVPVEPLQSSEDMSRQPQDKVAATGDENDDQQRVDGQTQQTISRRGIWEWARTGTGRLNIIGRIPHPEWRGPVAAKSPEAITNGSVAMQDSQDDFSIPSTTNSRPNDSEKLSEDAIARFDGLGISHLNNTSPSFSQTKRSSDELVAAASSVGTPASKFGQDDQSTNEDQNTPSAVSKDSPPSTPDTPTPQQRHKNTFVEALNSKDDENLREPESGIEPLTPEDAATTSKKEVQNGEDSLSGKETPKKPTKTGNTSDLSTPETQKKSSAGDSTKTKLTSKNGPSPQRIPKYKIALASNLLSPARTGTTST